MLPRLLLITIFGISALATKPEISEDKDTKKKTTHLDYKYGYSLPGSNNAYQGHAEFRTGKEISGNFVVQLPEGQSLSDVQYTADDKGFHPVVRITTKGNNSQVTSHFALGESAVNRLNQQEYESPKNQSTILSDSISKVLATLFPDGIPSNSQNLTKETISTEWDDGVGLVQTTTAPLIPFENITKSISIENVDSTHIGTFNDSTNVAHTEHQNKELFPDFDFDTVPKSEKEKTQENDKKVLADLESSKDLPDLVQNLVSGDDLVRINEAAEEYIMNERKRQPFLPTTVRPFQTRLESNSVDGSHQYYDELFPFENPIVVDEIFDDNIIAFSQDNNNMRFALPPPTEVQILPSRENFVNIENVESERQINVQIIQDKENEGKLYEKPILKSEDSQDLDPFQKSVEEHFSKGYVMAEAPSRIFLRKFNESLLKKSDTVTNSRGRSLDLSNSSINTFDNESIDDDSLPSELTSEVFLAPIHVGANVSSSNTNIVESLNTSTARPRGKTFVEVQKAINIQNLLIKEDGESIERHEEYLQPLANNGAYTHIIDSKFMKDKPQRYGDNQVLSENNIQNFASTENPLQQFSLETQQFLESHFQTSKNSGQKAHASTIVEKVSQNSIPDYYAHKYQAHNAQEEKQQHQLYQAHNLQEKNQQYQQYKAHIVHEDHQQHQQYQTNNEQDQQHHQDQLEQQKLLNQQREIQQHEQKQQQITDELIKSLEYSFPQDQHSKTTNNEIHQQEITTENSDIHQQQLNNENSLSYQQQINNENSFNHQQQFSIYTQKYHQQTPQHYQSEKIVERPIEKIVEKEIRVPYPVKEYIEKIVEKPIEIQKFIDRPIPVPYPVPIDRIINRPYPVEKLVEKPVHIPYPVEKIVETFVDRPVEVQKFIDRPYPVEKIVEKIVDRPVPVEVQKFIDRPYPVEKIVEKIVDRPVPVHVPIQIPIQVPIQVPFPSHISYSTLNHLAPLAFNNGHQQHLSNNHALNFNHNGYQYALLGNLPSYRDPYSIFQQQQQHHIQQHHQQQLIQQQHHQQQQHQQQQHQQEQHHQQQLIQQQQQNNHHNHQQQQQHQQSQQQPLHIQQNPVQNPCLQFKHLCRPHLYQTMRYAKKYTYKDNALQNHIKDDYLGPVPVENGCSHWGTGCQFKRSSDFGRNLRMEYGFKPPLIPSIEIDDQGLPINRKSRR